MMRIWCDVYDSTGTTKQGDGPVFVLTSAAVTRMLDGAGTIEISAPAEKRALELLTNERFVIIYVQVDDEPARELGRGYIRKRRLSQTEQRRELVISGVDASDAFTRRSVLLARAYDAETLQAITNNLVGLVSGWTGTVEAPYNTELQTARYDGTNVWKALIRTAEEKGLHVRLGTTPNTLEIGAFGEDSGIRAIKPPSSLSREIYSEDNILFVDNITVQDETGDVTNWIIPMGAGEGSAATTLREATASGSYPIQTMTGPDGQTLYYLRDTASITTYGQIERVVSFKEIGPVANSGLAKELASNALYDAASAWLQRNSVKLTTYKISAKKCKTTIRPGDKIRLQYKDIVETFDGDVIPIDVDELVWVMKVTERVRESGMTLDLEVATIDRYNKDTKKILVDALESLQARNVSIQTFPFGFQDSSERIIQGNVVPNTPYKTAVFSIQVPDIFTDVIRVSLRVITRPLYTLTDVGPTTATPPEALLYNYAVYEGSNYPSDITLSINGVDRTSALGGPWNPSAGNSPVDVTLDITDYIVNASGGLYQNHTLVFAAGNKVGEGRVNTAHPSSVGASISHGIVEAKVLFLGTARAVIPAPN